MSLRILHVTPSLGASYGGPAVVVRDLTRALAKQGLTVDVATTDDDGEGTLDVPLDQPVERDGVQMFHLPRRSSGSYLFSWALTRWLWRNVAAYDVVHVHSVFSYPSLAASRIAGSKKRPYVLSPHGMVEPWSLNHKGWKKAPYMRLVERQTLSRAAALHALADAERRNIEALRLSAPVFVLPNGVDLDAFATLPERAAFESRYPETAGKKIVLFMGRIDPKKGLDLLVRAFADVTRRDLAGRLHLVIAGPDLVDHKAAIENLIAAEGIGESVTFTGLLEDVEKLRALAAADLYVLPSHSEGFSMATLEALAAGCAVVITEACNFPEVTNAGAGVVIQTAVEPLTEALDGLLRDDARRREMGRRGRELVFSRYGWSSIARGMSEVYADVARRVPREAVARSFATRGA